MSNVTSGINALTGFTTSQNIKYNINAIARYGTASERKPMIGQSCGLRNGERHAERNNRLIRMLNETKNHLMNFLTKPIAML
jgi:hypothetical protein